MHSLVINCGSSSLKFALIKASTNETILEGVAEPLGSDYAKIVVKYHGEKFEESLVEVDHFGAAKKMFTYLQEFGLSGKIDAVGHRVVHGAEYFKSSVLIDQATLDAIERCNPLAPLHNPANLIGIKAAMEVLPNHPHVAVFDTAFHQSMPEKAYLYGLPMEIYRKYNVRRYGFHGTSHRFITEQAAIRLNKPMDELNIISAHLGNGASIAAVKDGKSVDTSMGLTPLEGLVMGTRSGSIDPGLFKYLEKNLNYSIDEIDQFLNKESGLLGLSELSNDCRQLQEHAQKGHRQAALALEIFSYRIAKQIAAYLVPLERLDALVFTGGIGENSSYVRKQVIDSLAFMRYELNEEENLRCFGGYEGTIATSPVFGDILVVCTDEEGMIARDTLDILQNAELKEA
ncbi:MAG: acetate kinase [Xanthomonadaceae bacterium]|nr:acetate kinase [Xanthomonadaceae bacterium]